MKLEFIITKENLIEYQLYDFSIKKNNRKNRFKTNLPTIIMYLYFLFNLISENYSLSIISLIFAIIFHFLYSKYLKSSYKTHFTKHVEENHKDRFDKTNSISFENFDFIECKNNIGEIKINVTSIEKIHENKNLFFLFIIGGSCLIIPKNEVDTIETKTILNSFSSNHNIIYFENLNWKW